VLVSVAYVLACRLFALVLLLARRDASKELEIVVLRASWRSFAGRRGGRSSRRAIGSS